ncbi:hypothetical protein MGG_16867 [Pyricularia oryzae 70-15]|uniref:DNA damage-binding protein 1 n=3 Tax=Pyricularia oryzae TaxID=318829 RepID=G4N4E2_PYRO7|nr:uncharacterized protein MGG_16867 [Pyricularia oryzae 70-15]EHA52810.1 hypothetical protein MGG_16867 [Pyricularia oryzae 70-15]ELQ34110.1 DNA damage-binding protein 1a [Pyricularia oryzae Y34]KAI7917515.1 DNA damage-binding protein 1a [Pyricularia oryzae]KAI7918915.1 DNA damage-binding protein 1a [Pyricularia oryzae]
MAYIAPIHRSSSVRHALYIQLLAGEEPSLVLAKTNRLEIWRRTDEGQLKLEHSQSVFGKIVMLQAVRPKDSETDMLFVGTDRFKYFTAEYDPDTRELVTRQAISDLGEQFVREVSSRNRCIVDPSGRYMVLLLWSGIMHVWRLHKRKGQQKGQLQTRLELMDQARISELYIKDAVFLHSETAHPRIAFLYQPRPNEPDCKFASYRLCTDDRDRELSRFEQKDREFTFNVPDPGSTMMIPVERVETERRHNFRNPARDECHLGGVIVVGESRMLYIDDQSWTWTETALKNAMVFVAWAKFDNTHYLLADDYGGLHLLTIQVKQNSDTAVDHMSTVQIGTTSRATKLVYSETNRTLFVASHYGDSQFYDVNLFADAAKGESFLELRQTIENIAPILDFAVMDMGNREGDSQLGNEYSSGQARIVTASGAQKDGSLRSVRSGVGLEDIGVITDEISGVTGLFSLKSYGSDVEDTLVVSFLTETRVFRFDKQGEVEELSQLQGLDISQPTLLVLGLDNGHVLYVTEEKATLFDAEGGVTISSWSPTSGKPITHASSNGRWVLLSVDGRKLVSLNIGLDLKVSAESEERDEDQISCVNASPHLLDVGAVGFWSSGTISIIDLKTLEATQTEKLRRNEDDAVVAREVVLARVLPAEVANPTLFVSKDDGEVMTFVYNDNGTLSSRKSVVLGTREARFRVLPQPNGLCSIFVTCEHSSLIHGAERRIVYSAVTAHSAAYVCPFDTAAFRDCLAVATESAIDRRMELKISRIDRQRQCQMMTRPMGENVRSIAYSSADKVFGLGCIRRVLSRGIEKVYGTFKLFDEVIFEPKGNVFALEDGEVPECVTRAPLLDSYGEQAERFIVGTRYLSGTGSGHGGRVLVFGVDESRSPYLIHAHSTKSGCRRIATMDDDLLVIALTKTVVLVRYSETSTTSAKFLKVAAFQTSSYAVDVTVHGKLIAVADIMKSITLLEYIPGVGKSAKTGGKDKATRSDKEVEGSKQAKLVEVCRDYQAMWSTAVSHLEGDSWIVADGDGNLVVLLRNTAGVTLEDKRRMQMTSEFGLGECVNKIQKVMVETSANAPIVAKAFLSTTEGSIYLFGTVAPKFQSLLMDFQANMEAHVSSPLGELQFNQWRSFRNPEREGAGPERFLDGEFLEMFLDMEENTQIDICQGLSYTAEDMRNLIGEMKNMH